MRKLFITAGHHLADPGAIANGYQENKLNIEIRDLVVKRIREAKPHVSIFIDNDKDTLSQVIKKINKEGSSNDLQVEFHFDSSNSPKPSGVTALVSDAARSKSKEFAKDLSDATSEILSIPNRGVKSEKESHRGRLGILHTKPSAVLLEVGFISNPSDVSQYIKHSGRLAEKIAAVIIKHLE